MSGFQEHFLDKYFAYRRRYVEAVVAQAPHRRAWAVASEIARLAFVIFGNALCALIFGALAVAAFGRSGIAVLPLVFAVLTILPLYFGVLAIGGLIVALGERRAGAQTEGAAAPKGPRR